MMQFKNDFELAKYIQSLGGTLYLVGGAIRDELLGKKSKDRDYVVTGIKLETLASNFDKIIGQAFPVFLVKIGDSDCELALARKEKKSGSGYHGFEFFSDPTITIEQDLFRRDVTINSIAQNVLTHEIIDPYGGLTALEKKLLIHTSNAFSEDVSRIFRVARFAAQLKFSVSDETIKLMATMREELKSLTAERVWKELEQVLNNPKPSTFFLILKEADVLDVWFPEVAALDVPDRHDNTTLEHVMKVIDVASTPLERFGVLCHDLGKPLTPKEEFPAHFGHDKLGVKPVLDLCNRLKVPTEYKEFGLLCAEQHMNAHRLADMRSGKLVRWVLQNKKYINQLMEVVKLDGAYREGIDREAAIKEWNYLRNLVDIALSTEKAVTGQQLIDLGIPNKGEEGKKFGEKLYQKRVEQFIKKRKEYENG